MLTNRLLLGKVGANVTGGIGGRPTSFGDNTYFQSHYTEGLFATKFFEKWYHVYKGTDPGAIIGPGANGTLPKSCPPKKPSIIQFNTFPAILAYKEYVRDNLANSAWRTSLWSFTKQLSANKAIQSFYGINHFFDEFKSLESDYFRLKIGTDFKLLYQILRNQFEQFRAPANYQKYWQFLYAAIISKSLAIRDHTNLITFENLFQDVTQMKKNIEELHHNRLTVLESDSQNHKCSLKDRIKSSKQLIATFSMAVNRTFGNAIPGHWDNFEQLQTLIVKNQMAMPIKMIETLLSLTVQDFDKLAEAVPKKTATVQAIIDGISKPYPILTSATPYKTAINRITDQFNQKYRQFKEILGNLNDILKRDSSSKLNNIKQIVHYLRGKVDELLGKTGIPNVESIKYLADGQENLGNAIDNMKSQFNQQQKEGRNVNAALEVLNRMQYIMKCSELSFEFYKMFRTDGKKMKDVGEQIDQFQGQLNQWKRYEQRIYDIVLPSLKEVDQFLTNSKFLNTSHFEMNSSNWTLVDRLVDLKTVFRKIRQRPLYDAEFARFIEKLIQGIEIVISVHHRLNVYSDKAKVVTLLQNFRIESTEKVFEKQIQMLNQSLHSSLMQEHCNTAIKVLKLRTFPFDPKYLKVCELKIDSKIRYAQANSGPQNEVTTYLDFTMERPFFIWKYQSIKTEMHHLLSGGDVFLIADIPTSISQMRHNPYLTDWKMNAVRFKEISLHFHANTNQTKQSNLDKTILGFQIEMTMVGNNYFKCDKRIYFVPNDVDIMFKFHTSNEKIDTTSVNDVYTGFMEREHVLSPYSMWKIKLNSKTNNFDALKPFLNQNIDLLLIGKGEYIENKVAGLKVCSENFDNYQLDTIL